MTVPEAPPEPNRDLPPEGGQSVEPTPNTTETRTQLVSLYVQGSDNDARAMYTASPGATEAGWTALDRMLAPVKAFVQNGDPPYMQTVWTGEYSGVGDIRSQDQEAAQLAGPPVQGENASGEPVTDTLPEGQPTNITLPEGQPTNIDTGTSGTSAAELIARAQAATTGEELDEIEGLANGRVTVLDAVDVRRSELSR